jgi:hypothetical protein
MGTTLLADFLGTIRTDAPVNTDGLAVIPLIGPSRVQPAFCLYTPALATKVTVGEVSKQGVVRRLRVHNPLSEPVLIMASQVLVGGKQDRVAATDVLVPAGESIDLPCACVEQGSWSYRSATFTPAAFMHRDGRAKSASFLAQELKSTQAYSLDQEEIWSEAQCLVRQCRSDSATHAMQSAYVSMADRLEAARRGLSLLDAALGIAVLARERLLGLDLFDRASTFAQVKDRLLDSYTIDWLRSDGRATADDAEHGTDDVASVIELMSRASWEEHTPPGLGRDCRWTSEDWTASALTYSGSALHVQAFPTVKRRVPEAIDAEPERLVQAQPRVVSRVRQVRPRRNPLQSTPQREGTPDRSRCPRCEFSYARVVVEGGIYCNHCGHLEYPTLFPESL